MGRTQQTDCLEKYLPKSSCDPTDVACICADTTLMGEVETCALGACTIFEGLGELLPNTPLLFCASRCVRLVHQLTNHPLTPFPPSR